MGIITAEQVQKARFRKSNLGGYRMDEVDSFLDQIVETLEALDKSNLQYRSKTSAYESELNEREKQIKNLEAETARLRSQVVDSHSDEISIGQVLLGAQRQADLTIQDANQKAAVILENAREEARSIIQGAQDEVNGQKDTIEALKQEVASFKSKLLGIYREHLLLIDALPENEEAKRETPLAEDTIPEEAPIPEELPEETPAEEISSEDEVSEAEESGASAEAEAPKAVEEESVAAFLSGLQQLTDELLEPEEAPESPSTENVAAAPKFSFFDADEDDSLPVGPSRFESLKFGDDYDLKSDPDMKGRKKR